DLTRAGDAGALAAVGAGRREELDAAVLAVRDVDGAVRPHGQAVGEVELTRAAAGFPPGLNQAAVGREAVDPGVAVAVRDVKVTRRPERQVGRVVERRAGPPGGPGIVAGRPRVGGPAARAPREKRGAPRRGGPPGG